MSIDIFYLFSCCHKQEPCQLVNRFMLAHIMPSKRHGNIFTYSNIMICHVASLYRYRPIYQFKSEIKPYHHTATPIKRSQRPSSFHDFRRCLPIYSKVALFTTCCKITATRHNSKYLISPISRPIQSCCPLSQSATIRDKLRPILCEPITRQAPT